MDGQLTERAIHYNLIKHINVFMFKMALRTAEDK